MKIVVVGATGLVGRNIVRRLRAGGHDVRPASRVSGVDIITGAGLAESLVNADVVIDASNSPVPEGPASFDFFRIAIANLLDAEAKAGVRHHVGLSVVGTDRLGDSPYFQGKSWQERAIRASGLPFTLVHATQFFEFLLHLVEASVYDQALRLSPAYIQPVASADVAVAMAELAVRLPRNTVIEMAGPERERLSELIQRFLIEVDAPYEVVTDVFAPYFGAMLDDDSLLPGCGARVCSVGFAAWLNQSEYWGAHWQVDG